MSLSSSSEDLKNDASVAIDSKSPSELEATFASDQEDRFASIDRKKLLRRIDTRILIYICITYMFVRLDLNSKSSPLPSKPFSQALLALSR